MASSFVCSHFEGLVLVLLMVLFPSPEATVDNVCSGVPAVHLVGDSLLDVGNNNNLLTDLRANFPHNGIDFAGGKATGRFNNGKNIADFIAEKLGLPSPPAYLSINKSGFFSNKALGGINFASGGAGILNTTNAGLCLSMNEQIGYLSTSYALMTKTFGDLEAQKHIAQSIFAIVIGSNDIFAYVQSNSTNTTTPHHFVDSLIYTLKGQLQSMYNIGARKFVFLGTGSIGCCPFLRRQSNTKGCNAVANSISDLYNNAATSLLEKMKSQLTDMNYSFFNTTIVLHDIMQNATTYGFTEVKAACCGLGELNADGPCIPTSDYCSNRTNHVFWDFVHPTEAVAGILTDNIFDGSAPRVYPVNLRQLSAL